MVALYVVSPDKGAGKTAICSGLVRHFQNAGKKVGFLKVAEKSLDGAIKDAAFMKQVLSLPESEELLVSADTDNIPAAVKKAFTMISKGNDLVLIEGIFGQTPDNELSRTSYQTAQALNARVIAVENYQSVATRFTNIYKEFGENLLGVIVNKVPKRRLNRVTEEVKSQFGAFGINILAVFPEDRALLSLTVGELADILEGTILNFPEMTSDIVENFMLGALCVDSGVLYFGRKVDKAAILRYDRPDMQLAALETPMKCLIISGTRTPVTHSVLSKAEHRKVPVILTESSINDIVTKIEKALEKGRFNQLEKLPRFSELMRQNIKLTEFSIGLGLAG